VKEPSVQGKQGELDLRRRFLCRRRDSSVPLQKPRKKSLIFLENLGEEAENSAYVFF